MKFLVTISGILGLKPGFPCVFKNKFFYIKKYKNL